MSRWLLASTVLFLFTLTPLWAEQTFPSSIMAGEFSKGPDEKGLPFQWHHLHFRGVRRTQYKMVQIRDTWVVKAESKSSASGLITRLELNPKEFPIMKWRWRVDRLLEKTDLTTKSGDDHPARIYVGFEYDRSSFSWREKLFYWMVRLFYGKDYPARAINYIWTSHEPVESVTPNPYTSWVKTVVVESGEKNLGEWVEVTRNVYEDYQRIFGGDPPIISGIGIMTDSDGTEEQAVAYYGDVMFLSSS